MQTHLHKKCKGIPSQENTYFKIVQIKRSVPLLRCNPLLRVNAGEYNKLPICTKIVFQGLYYPENIKINLST